MNLVGTDSNVFVLGRTEFHVKLGEGSVCVFGRRVYTQNFPSLSYFDLWL